jgi:catalase-peroxidase
MRRKDGRLTRKVSVPRCHHHAQHRYTKQGLVAQCPHLDILRQHDTRSNPLGDVDYRTAVKSLDLAAVKAGIRAVMRDSQAWWPAD